MALACKETTSECVRERDRQTERYIHCLPKGRRGVRVDERKSGVERCDAMRESEREEEGGNNKNPSHPWTVDTRGTNELCGNVKRNQCTFNNEKKAWLVCMLLVLELLLGIQVSSPTIAPLDGYSLCSVRTRSTHPPHPTPRLTFEHLYACATNPQQNSWWKMNVKHRVTYEDIPHAACVRHSVCLVGWTQRWRQKREIAHGVHGLYLFI